MWRRKYRHEEAVPELTLKKSRKWGRIYQRRNGPSKYCTSHPHDVTDSGATAAYLLSSGLFTGRRLGLNSSFCHIVVLTDVKELIQVPRSPSSIAVKQENRITVLISVEVMTELYRTVASGLCRKDNTQISFSFVMGVQWMRVLRDYNFDYSI